jgi:hypothetical protein
MSDDAGDHELLLGRAPGGDCGALAELFERLRGWLEHRVRLRLDRRPRCRLGRSRGGFSTKVHLACTDERTAVAAVLTPGQAGDAPAFEGLWPQARARAGVADEVVADRSYDSDAIRCQLIDEGVARQIPNHPRRATKFVKTLPPK